MLRAIPKKSEKYLLNAKNTGDAKLRVVIGDSNRNYLIVYDSKELAASKSADFKWHLNDFDFTTIAISGVGNLSSVSCDLLD